MGLVGGILTIVAGIIYIAYQLHKEKPGVITFIVFAWIGIFAFGVGIPMLIRPLFFYNYALGMTLFVLYLIALAVGVIYWACVGSSKALKKEAKESAEIWKEVNELPEPDAETLLSYREALGMPRYPIDDKAMNQAAREAWRREQYNIRYKKKHKFVIYL